MDFEELVNKFLAILMSLFDALGKGRRVRSFEEEVVKRGVPS